MRAAPFDLHRDGGVLSEGCGMVLVENYDHARARGARPYLEVRGYGTGSDQPDTLGHSFEFAMRRALANSALYAGEVDYVCAHGPSDVELDALESAAVRRVLGPRAYRIPVSSIKGVTGNPLSAAGLMELAACAMAVRTG